MSRPRRSRYPIVTSAAAVLALLVALAGCGTSPTAPPSGDQAVVAQGPEVLKVHADGSTSFVPMSAVRYAPTPLPGGSELIFDPTRRLTVTAEIDGAVGGRLICGPYVLTFPAGVFAGVGTVTMTMPDSTIMLCDLDVLPAELNDFLKPVDLALHTSGTDADLDSLQMYWWDEEKASWVDMGCQKETDLERVLDAELLTLDAATGVRLQLSHFSRYATGKAGW
ncbi:MAG TPA: hypothetical protein VLT84_10535 [Acidobacteriota bacterium]|nr:hypothetical protein [Acidobacteriota bacterium]